MNQSQALKSKREASNLRVPYIPFHKDRVQLSSDILEARQSKEAPERVHARNPHTTYLSQIDMMVDMIVAVGQAQEQTKQPEAPAAKATPVKAAGQKPKPLAKPARRPSFSAPPLKKALPRPR